MGGVLRAEPVWGETFTGLRIDRFAKLVKVVKERGGNGPGGGRPWCLPLTDRVPVVARGGPAGAGQHRGREGLAGLRPGHRCEGVTVPADGAYINTGLVVPHRKRPGRALLPGEEEEEEEDNAEHRRVRARVEHAFARMKHYKILRDCRQRGDGLHHAVQAVAHMHNLALAA